MTNSELTAELLSNLRKNPLDSHAYGILSDHLSDPQGPDWITQEQVDFLAECANLLNIVDLSEGSKADGIASRFINAIAAETLSEDCSVVRDVIGGLIEWAIENGFPDWDETDSGDGEFVMGLYSASSKLPLIGRALILKEIVGHEPTAEDIEATANHLLKHADRIHQFAALREVYPDDCEIVDMEPGYDDETVEVGGMEFRLLDEDQRESVWDEALENYLDECIYPELPELAKNYFDDEKWKRDARMDGAGVSLAHYDHAEEYACGLFIYRVN